MKIAAVDEGVRVLRPQGGDESAPRALDALFRPRSVAVVGASRRRGSVGAEIFHNLLTCGFPGAVYPINHKADAVQSVRAYHRLSDVPETVDLVVLAVPAARIPDEVDACIAAGVGALVVISAGFSELGPEGAQRQRLLAEKVRGAGIRMIGPNCLGVLSTDPTAPLNATFSPAWPPSGNIAFSSQSGAVGLAVLDAARELGIGISQFASVGNRADVSGNDLLEHWENDPRTDVILLYVESFGNPRRFLDTARRVARKKPIVVVKSGRTAAGARAAGSHTGAIATADVAVEALLGQAGVIRTDTIEQLFDIATLLAHQPLPAGDRVAILTNAGGPGIMAADACETNRLTLPALGAATTAALRRFLPAEASVTNPIDMIASATPEAYRDAVSLLLADESVDALVVVYVPPLVTSPLEVAAAIRDASVGAKKPVLVCLIGGQGVAAARDVLRTARLAVYHFPENAIIALGRAVSHGKWLGRPAGRPLGTLPEARAQARRWMTTMTADGPRWLDPEAVRGVLSAYGITTPSAEVVGSEDAAVLAAERVGYPVALKIVSDTISHKTDVGGVALGLGDKAAVRGACKAIVDRLIASGRSSELRGFLVQGMADSTQAVETFVGMTTTRDCGQLLAFGLGGTALEVHRDVVFRINPITDDDATDMLEQIRGAALLRAFRGRAAVDKDALRDLLRRTSQLAADFPSIVELDFNPVLALPEGRGAIVVDARIRTQ